jgi:hypothetical protein
VRLPFRHTGNVFDQPINVVNVSPEGSYAQSGYPCCPERKKAAAQLSSSGLAAK